MQRSWGEWITEIQAERQQPRRRSPARPRHDAGRRAGCREVHERQYGRRLRVLINGNMAVSASGQVGLLLRVDPAKSDELVTEPHVRRFEMRGREMHGWIRVDAEAGSTDEQLARWVNLGLIYAQSLPRK